LTNSPSCDIIVLESEGTTMFELLDANLNYYEIHDLRIILEILADKGFSNTTIEELLKNVKKVEETY
jgi:hypothetical protein